MDRINRRAWSARSTVESFRNREGWTDPGERAAFDAVRAAAADQPILDIGVGAGRTVPLLLSISHDYVAVDYTPALLDICRQKYPRIRAVEGDARNLYAFRTDSFQLVVFSFNGIDAVNAEDRAAILREVRRVLRPGGTFLFSTHNRNGPGYDEPLSLGIHRTRNPLKLAARVGGAMVRAARTIRNYRRYRDLADDHDEYSIRNASAHDHGIVIHYVTQANQLTQLAAAEFRHPPLVFASSDGRRLSPVEAGRDAWWFHLVVRK
jgi:SAM-dependent methyltransferase